MVALVERLDQTVSASDISRSAKDLLDRLASGEQDRFVVMRNNAPAAVMMGVEFFQALTDELEDLRVEMLALQRIASLNSARVINEAEMLDKFGLSNDDNNMDSELP